MARVTVVIPCYNAGRFLAEAIDSVHAQTLRPDEIIVVDDASTDDTLAFCDERVSVVRLPINRGAAAARNEGLRHASGELVAWLDADDAWEPHHLAHVVPLLDEHPEVVLAFSRCRIIGAAEGEQHEWPALLPAHRPVHAFPESMVRCVVPHNSVVVRREAVLDAGGYDERLRQAEDFDLWLRLSYQHPFVCTHELTTRLRRHEGQTSRSLERYWMSEYEARRAFLDARTRAADPGLPRIEAAIRSAWQYHLDVAWHNRRLDWLDLHVAQASWIPGAAEQLLAQRRRRRLLPFARLWDALPLRVRQGMRSLRRVISGHRATA